MCVCVVVTNIVLPVTLATAEVKSESEGSPDKSQMSAEEEGATGLGATAQEGQ